MIDIDPQILKSTHQWQIDVACDCHGKIGTIYIGQDYRHMFKRLGEMCLSMNISKIVVYRDGEIYREIVVRERKKE